MRYLESKKIFELKEKYLKNILFCYKKYFYEINTCRYLSGKDIGRSRYLSEIPLICRDMLLTNMYPCIDRIAK